MKLLDRIKSYAIASPVGYFVTGTFANEVAQDISHWTNGQFEVFGDIKDVGMLGVGLWIIYKNISTYRRMRDTFEERGYNERFAKPKLYSWCDRNSVRTAASETGHLDEYLEQCEKEGHKWYHFLPKLHRFDEVQH